MAEKVNLPKEVAEAIDTISRIDGYKMRLLEAMLNPKSTISAEMKVVDDWADKEYGNFEILLQALVNGYEVEQTPEEKVREYYQQAKSDLESSDYDLRFPSQERVVAIIYVLDTLGIKIEGVNA